MTKIDLTRPQIDALLCAAMEVEAGPDPDLWPATKLNALSRATDKLGAAIKQIDGRQAHLEFLRSQQRGAPTTQERE